jgi:photosystem II stability/assembly factor-like uncharacterized protein
MKTGTIFSRLVFLFLCLPGLCLEASEGLGTRVIDQDLRAILSVGADELLAAASDGNLVRSVDGGLSFEVVEAGDAQEPIFALAQVGDTVVAVGRNGLILRSGDRGTTWAAAEAEPILGDLRGVDGNGSGRWVAVGAEDEKPAVLVSNNDGRNWTTVTAVLEAAELYGIVWHEPSSRFVAVGGDGFFEGRVFSSIDGKVWTPVPALPATAGQLRFISVHGTGALLAGGESGTLIRSIGGSGAALSFEKVPGTAVSEKLTSGLALASDGDWAVGGESQLVLHVTTAGAAILRLASPPAQPVEAMAFVAPATVLLGGPYADRSEPKPPPAPPTTTSPANLTVSEESRASFAVQVTGLNLAIQWQRSTDGGQNWNPIPGATAASYTEPKVTLAQDGHRYRVVVSNSSGTATSGAALLTVTALLAPSESRFGDTITGAEILGYLFLPDGKFRRIGPNGNLVEGEWFYQRDGESETGVVIQLIDDLNQPQPLVRNLFLDFKTPTSADYILAGSTEVGEGRLSFEFDFFGLPRAPVAGVRSSAWLGRFDDTFFNYETRLGWIDHAEHGWLYGAGLGSPGGIWFWDAIQKDWLWTRFDRYPFFYSDQRQSWAFYQRGGQPDHRFFFYYDVDAWEEIK